MLYVKAEYLELSKVKKAELFDFMKAKRPKLALEHAEDEKKKKIVDNYKKVAAATFKKNPIRI